MNFPICDGVNKDPSSMKPFKTKNPVNASNKGDKMNRYLIPA